MNVIRDHGFCLLLQIRKKGVDLTPGRRVTYTTITASHVTYARQTLEMWLLMAEILAHFALTIECNHLPKYALSREPKNNFTRGKEPQLEKGKIAPTIEAAVLCAEKTFKDLEAKIARLQATQPLTPADAEELAQALAALPLAKERTNPGFFYQKQPGLGPVWVQYPKCVEHHPTKLCGWPLQKFPAGWLEKSIELLKKFDKLVIGPEFRGLTEYYEPKISPSRIIYYAVLVDCLRACVDSRTGDPCVLDGLLGNCPRRGACVVDDCVGICPRQGACAVRACVDGACVDDAGVDDACVGICPRKRPKGLEPWQVGQLRMELAALSIWGGLESSVNKERIEQTQRYISELIQYEQISCP